MTTAQALDIDFSKAAILGNDVLDLIDRLRDAAPIYWSAANQCWLITGHREVVEAFKGDLPFSNKRAHRVFLFFPEAERAKRIPYMLESLPKWIIDMDPPDQTRLRRLMSKAFTRQNAESLREPTRAIIREALDDAGRQGTCDFVATVARVIPSRVILRLLGLSDDLVQPMRRWTDKISAALGGFALSGELLDDCEKTLHEMRDVFLPEIEKRRRAPTGDFLSALVLARDEGDKLTDEEMLGACYLTLLAGNDSTGGTLGLGAAALAQHPQACDYIRTHPQEIADIIMELQRYVSMSTMQPRVIDRDFVWRGHSFKKGQFAMIMVAGANRDPLVFKSPTTLDFSQRQEANMTFGPGLHFCIGHLLAKMQMTEFFPELVRRFDLEVLDKRLDFQSALAFRGLTSLTMRLTPRAPS